ncbi:MAG: hypothetical protein IT443_01805 [Phycisphaeraceae bacterium]|nr:hypothetical protein [Phycisphaeraceae bacterium]
MARDEMDRRESSGAEEIGGEGSDACQGGDEADQVQEDGDPRSPAKQGGAGRKGSGEASAGGGESDGQRLVPVTEAIRYRKRAQVAEQTLTAAQRDLERQAQELRQVKERLAQVERQGDIDRQLTEAQTIDLEATGVLTQAALAAMAEPDVAAAVEELRRQKPYLFRQRPRAHATAMPAQDEFGLTKGVDIAREQAAQSGHRLDLLRYLRLRRGK